MTWPRGHNSDVECRSRQYTKQIKNTGADPWSPIVGWEIGKGLKQNEFQLTVDSFSHCGVAAKS